MSYSYGLSIINSYLEAFASIVITEKGLVQKEFWNLIKDKNVTSFGGVPFTYEMLHRLKFFQMVVIVLNVKVKMLVNSCLKFLVKAKHGDKEILVK